MDNNNNNNNSDDAPPPRLPGLSAPTTYTKDRFRSEELEVLMQIMEQILPIGQVEWETVGHDYNAYFPDRMRNLDNLRRQFNRQVKKKAPTGDPNVPTYVLLAKRIQEEIVKKADAVKLGEDEDTDVETMKRAVGKPIKKNSSSESDEKTTTANRRGRNTTGDSLLQAYLMSEANNRERERKEEKKERRRERKRELEAQQNFQMMMGILASAVAAFTGQSNPNMPTPGVPVAAMAPAPSRPSSSVFEGLLDDSDSEDSALVPLRRTKLAKTVAASMSNHKANDSSDSDNDSDTE